MSKGQRLSLIVVSFYITPSVLIWKFCKWHQNHCFMFQNLTRHKALAATCQTKPTRIRCCFFSQSSVSPGRVWGSQWTMLALNLLARRWDATASNGVLHPNRFFTRLMNDRRTPAKRRGRHWWRSATGTDGLPMNVKTSLTFIPVMLICFSWLYLELNASREEYRLLKLTGLAPTWSRRCESTTGLPTGERRRPLDKNWLWMPIVDQRTVWTPFLHTVLHITHKQAVPHQARCKVLTHS